MIEFRKIENFEEKVDLLGRPIFVATKRPKIDVAKTLKVSENKPVVEMQSGYLYPLEAFKRGCSSLKFEDIPNKTFSFERVNVELNGKTFKLWKATPVQ